MPGNTTSRSFSGAPVTRRCSSMPRAAKGHTATGERTAPELALTSSFGPARTAGACLFDGWETDPEGWLGAARTG